MNEARQTKTKIVRTALDRLPYGDATAENVGKSKEKVRLPEGVHRRELIRDVTLIAWPSLVELILTQLTSMADQIMVGRMPGEAGVQGLSAIGLAMLPKFLLMTMIMALNVGSTAVIARFRGQQNREKANQVFRQAILLNLLLGVIFSVVGWALSPALIDLMSGGENGAISPAVLQQAVSYLRIQMVGFLPLMFTVTVTAALRGIGDSRTPLFYNTIANVVNLVFNYVMIYGKLGCPAMGVEGAAWATNIGQIAACLIAVWSVRGDRRYVGINLKEKFRFDWPIMENVISIGLPSMIEQLLMRAGMIIFNRTVSSLGDVSFATHHVCMNIQAISVMIGQAFATSTTTLMGQSLGKRRYDMAVLYMRQTRLLGVAVSVVVGVLLGVFGRTIVSIYNTTPEVVKTGGDLLILLAFMIPVQSEQFIISGGLRGAGDTKFAAWVTAITALLIRSAIALVAVYVFKWGLWGAWIAMVLDQLVRSGFMLYRYGTGKWAHLSLRQMEKHATAAKAES